MAYLFKMEGSLIVPEVETLLMSPYKEIWERDKSKHKEKAKAELSYIEFMTSFKASNPYREYPEGDKHMVIKKDMIKDEDWEPDEYVKEGMEEIRRFQTEASTTYGFYMAAKLAAEKMKDFFKKVDINEKNFKTGNPVWKPRDIITALNDTQKTLNTLTNLAKSVDEDIYEEVKNRGNKEISVFAK